jgi:hypothetical protein
MKSFTTLAVLGASLLLLSGCGNNTTNPAVNYGAQNIPNYNQCGMGQTYTQQGCLPQGNCQYGMAQYGNTCIPAIQNNVNQQLNQCSYGQINTQYGCLPQGNCQYGMAQYGTTCVAAINNGYNTGYNYNYNYSYQYGNTNCQQGYLSTNYGCLPQANCGANMVFYQNACRQVYQNTFGGSFQFTIRI